MKSTPQDPCDKGELGEVVVLRKHWEKTQGVPICFANGKTKAQRSKGPILETGMQSSSENQSVPSDVPL